MTTDNFFKRGAAILLSACILTGCSSSQASSSGTADASAGSSSQTGEKVHLKFFTGKIETIDVMNEIINDFNASQDRIEVEQEYQKDASNVIKIKFASDEVPDIMTTYEQEFVDEGKYMDLTDMNEFWDRMSPEMKEAVTDVDSGKVYRICTNRTMAGIFYNKEILKAAGYEEFPSNFDDFKTMLEKIKETQPDVTPLFIFGSEAWHLGHWIEFVPHGYIKSTLGTIEAKKGGFGHDCG